MFEQMKSSWPCQLLSIVHIKLQKFSKIVHLVNNDIKTDQSISCPVFDQIT